MKLTRQYGLAAALLITLVLSARIALRDLAEPRMADVAHRVKQETEVGETTSDKGPPIKTGDGERDPLIDTTSDPFKVVNFTAPVQVASATPAPPPVVEAKPVAPQFPYRFFGRMVAVDGTTLTYLSRDNALVAIKVGTVLDEMYRVDAMTNKQISLTYTPLNESIAIAIPSAAE